MSLRDIYYGIGDILNYIWNLDLIALLINYFWFAVFVILTSLLGVIFMGFFEYLKLSKEAAAIAGFSLALVVSIFVLLGIYWLLLLIF